MTSEQPEPRRSRGRSRARIRTGVLLGAGALVVVVAVVIAGFVVSSSSDGRDDDEPAPEAATSVAGDWESVCGFPGQLVSKLVANAPADEVTPVELAIDEVDLQGANVLYLLANDSEVVFQVEGDTALSFVSYPLDGGEPSAFDVALDRGTEAPHGNGRAALADDGSLFVLDTYGGRRDVVRVDGRGARLSSFSVPASDVTTGHPLGLFDLVWLEDYDGAPAVAVFEQETVAHLFREDGTPLGDVDYGGGSPLGGLGGAAVAFLGFDGDGDGDGGSLRAYDLASRTQLADMVFDADSAVASARDLSGVTSVLPGPDGDGFLVYEPYRGVTWYDAIGINRGTWLPDQSGAALAGPGGLVYANGVYLVLVDTDDGATALARLSSDDMRSRLQQPRTGDANTVQSLIGLGVGVTPTTGRVYNHFDADDTPEAAVHFQSGWGLLGDTQPGADYELVYTVSGDPLLADPVQQEQMTAPVSVGGGDVPLTLPATRPGVYEAEVSLRDIDDGTIVSSTCLRYSIGAEGADLDLDELADGADWGGPAPLRGVQLAGRLGIGSYRYQLDFGELVYDPGSAADQEGLNLPALAGAPGYDDPGYTDEAAFAQLRAASELADQTGVKLIVQLGSGGEAEAEAVAAGTWEGWVELIVGEIAEHTGIRYWSVWNEPNQFISSGAEYATTVSEPFAQAAHRADPDSVVIGGNTLGFAYDWWKQAADAGICEDIDVVAVHPYTGWNRSWEEEGFAQEGNGYDLLRDYLGDSCAGLPIWDTESGWTSDGPASFWAQGANVARKLLWYQQEGVDEWTYFFSEGGWGESNLSWSLLQLDQYVKPGALAFSTVSRLLDGREAPTMVDTGVPFTYAMHFDGSDSLTAVWSDDMRIDMVVTTDAGELTVVDIYGARRVLPVTDGTATLTVTGSPQFIEAPDGASVGLSATRPFGDDVLAGQRVEVSSTHADSDPDVITSGTVDVYRPWRSGRTDGEVDQTPYAQVDLAAPTTIDRIAVATGSILCCETGLRDYSVSVLTPDGDWVVVAEQSGQFFERVVMFDIDPIEAVAVRVDVPWTEVRGVDVLAVNYAGFAGGLPPPFMGLQTESDFVVSISAISAWAAG